MAFTILGIPDPLIALGMGHFYYYYYYYYYHHDYYCYRSSSPYTRRADHPSRWNLPYWE